MTEHSVILYADIPELKIRKAIKQALDVKLSVVFDMIKKKVVVDEFNYVLYKRQSERFIKLNIEQTIQEAGLEDKQVIFFLRDATGMSKTVPVQHTLSTRQEAASPPASRASASAAFLTSENTVRRESSNVLKRWMTSSRKSQIPLKKSVKVFGTKLSELMGCSSLKLAPNGIPLFLELAIQRIQAFDMKTEGIFRLSGSAVAILELKNSIDNGESVEFNSQMDPHVVTGLIKCFLRELPEPLLLFRMVEVFRNIDMNGDHVVRYIRFGLKELPKENYILLKRLFGFFKQLNVYEQYNKMSLANIATVIGPNLLRQENEESSFDMMKTTSVVNNLAMKLIQFFTDIFENELEEIPIVTMARVIFDFDPTSSDELPMSKGDIVFVTAMEEGVGWWQGEINGNSGSFPSNYVEVMFSDSPTKMTDIVEQPAEEDNDPTSETLSETTGIEKCDDEAVSVKSFKKALRLEMTRRIELEQIVSILSEKYENLLTRIIELESKNDDSDTMTDAIVLTRTEYKSRRRSNSITIPHMNSKNK